MGLEELKAKIAADADDRIKSINAEADERINALASETKSSTAEKVGEIQLRGENTSRLEEKKIISAARVEAASMVSAEKNRVIGEAFSEARERILTLSDKNKKRILEKLAADAVVIEGTVIVRIDPEHAKLLPKAKGVKVEPAKLGDFGLILSSSNGLIEVDNTLTVVLSRLKGKIRPAVAKTLFGGVK